MPHVRVLSDAERRALLSTCALLGVRPAWLAAEIAHESRFDPTIQNQASTALGLLQWLDRTAFGMGHRFTPIEHEATFGGEPLVRPWTHASVALVLAYPTVEAQLRGPVVSYLRPMMPFASLQSLALAVFYPAARHWAPDSEFPDVVRRANPGIRFVSDYVARVEAAGAFVKWDGA